MFSLSTSGDCEVEKEKPRILPNMIPNLAHLFAASNGFSNSQNAATTNALRNFSTPNTTTSSTSQSPSATTTNNGNNLFPPFFNANLAQYYALMQQQNQFMAHFNAAKNNLNNGINGSNNSESNSSILSDSRASSTDSSSKKIKVDNDGNFICPICDEKLPNDSNWEKHVEIERKSLIKSIESIKEQKQSPENVAAAAASERSMSANRSKQKRESELQRIRSNQQKRLTCKFF
jgi:uncharacterized Zn finger protein (UPF0148 family)